MPSSSDEPDDKEKDAASCIKKEKRNLGVCCKHPDCTTMV